LRTNSIISKNYILCQGCYILIIAALYEKDAENYGEEDVLIKHAICEKNLETRRKLSCVRGTREGAKWRWLRAPHPAFFYSILHLGGGPLPPPHSALNGVVCRAQTKQNDEFSLKQKVPYYEGLGHGRKRHQSSSP
jgi:hypothetical protein